MGEDAELGGLGASQGVVAAVSTPATPTLTLHDLATGTPLELATQSSAALTALLATVPDKAVAVSVIATDQNGGEVGLAVGTRLGDGWSIGGAFQHGKLTGNKIGFQILKTF